MNDQNNSSSRGSRIRRAAGLALISEAVLFIGLLLFAIVGNWSESAVNQLQMPLLWLGFIPAIFLSAGIQKRFPNAFVVPPANQRIPRELLVFYLIFIVGVVLVGGSYALTYFVSSYVGLLWWLGVGDALLLVAGFELYRGKSIFYLLSRGPQVSENH
jgi:hypothetical protein